MRDKRVRIGKSFYSAVMLKVVSRNDDGSQRWLEVCRDDDTFDIADGGKEFYIVWGTDRLLGKGK